MAFGGIARFETVLTPLAPDMADTVGKARRSFGEPWERAFDETLRVMFGDDDARLRAAASGYVRFALVENEQRIKQALRGLKTLAAR